MKTNLKKTALALALSGALVTALLINDLNPRDDIEAVGIIFADGSKKSRIEKEFIVKSRAYECGEAELCDEKYVTFKDKEIRLYTVGAVPTDLPASAALIGTIDNPEERLIRLMEENGETKYKIIYE